MNLRVKSTQHWQAIWKEQKYCHNIESLGTLEHKIYNELEKYSQARDCLLEAGSGTGKVSVLLALGQRKVSLLDIAPEALDTGKKVFDFHGVRGFFMRGDIFDIPFRDNSFDVVWNAGVIEHFLNDEQQKIYCEMYRVCRPGGRIVIIAPSARARIYRYWKGISERINTWIFGAEFPVESLAGIYRGKTCIEYQICIAEQFKFISMCSKWLMPVGELCYRIINFLEKIPALRKMLLNRIGGFLLVSVFVKE